MKHVLIALGLILFISCGKDEKTDYVAENEAEIVAYIEKNNLQAEKSQSGLYYVIDEEGSGNRPVASSTVTVAYKGYYTNGKVFDQSNAEGTTFPLQKVISGWTEGIQYFKEGGSGMLLVPSHLGYGSGDYNRIPGGSVLIFDVHLISIDK
ncbi:MAG: FKBP-type peptidyl-prolyl cis-trans isomerase [Arenibacter latericius]|nr:FKBP-type peptidyl-prolyl cis-trans isomerase [Arenibacter latericius]